MKATNLQKALLALRLGVFIVMIMWTIDKFVNPGHAGAVFAKYYKIDGLSEMISYLLGSLQLAVVVSFLLGIKKRFTYGILLILHGISTLSTFAMYLDPWGPRNLLFFAAWPMLAAIYALYLMRDEDTLLTIKQG